MDKKLAYPIIIFVIAIAIIAVLIVQAGSTNTAQGSLKISNFQFSETTTGPDKLHITTLPGSITFEGPVTKPTPCHTLEAAYKTAGSDVIVNITAKGGSGFCIQVIKDTFYKGSFGYTGNLTGVTINYGSQELASAKL
ncbi:MAG: hypothetical protein NTY99_03125 [DPANN group archaeon]|nr:hypothetical protein [DPANN group archaeon]